MRKLENRKLPENISYEEIRGLRLEASKSSKEFVRTASAGLPHLGVSPADISVLLIYLESKKQAE